MRTHGRLGLAGTAAGKGQQSRRVGRAAIEALMRGQLVGALPGNGSGQRCPDDKFVRYPAQRRRDYSQKMRFGTTNQSLGWAEGAASFELSPALARINEHRHQSQPEYSRQGDVKLGGHGLQDQNDIARPQSRPGQKCCCPGRGRLQLHKRGRASPATIRIHNSHAGGAGGGVGP
jgi:hypothetical protein